MECRTSARKLVGLLLSALVSWPLASGAAPGDPLGPPVQVNLHGASWTENLRSVMASDDGFHVIWKATDGGNTADYQTFFGRDGARLTGDLPTHPLPTGAIVGSAADGRHLALYRDYNSLYTGLLVQRYDKLGLPVGAPIEVNETPILGQKLVISGSSIAINAAGEFAVAWVQDTATGTAYYNCREATPVQICTGTVQTRLMVRRFAADGTPSAPVMVHTATRVQVYVNGGGSVGEVNEYPSVAIDDDGGLAVVWRSVLYAGDPKTDRVKLRYLPPSGTAPLTRTVASSDHNNSVAIPKVIMDGRGNIVVAYRLKDFENHTLWVSRYATATSNALGPAVRVDSDTHPASPAVAWNLATDGSGAFALVWSVSSSVPEPGVFMQRYGADGSAQGGHIAVSIDNGRPARGPWLAAHAGRLIVVWSQSPGAGIATDLLARFYEAP